MKYMKTCLITYCVDIVVWCDINRVNLTSPAVVSGRQGASRNRGGEVVLEVKMITGETVHTVGSRYTETHYFLHIMKRISNSSNNRKASHKFYSQYPFVRGRSGGLESSSVAPLLVQLLLALPTDCPLGDTVGVCMPISLSCTPCGEVKGKNKSKRLLSFWFHLLCTYLIM